jgi:hypothetical protein
MPAPSAAEPGAAAQPPLLPELAEEGAGPQAPVESHTLGGTQSDTPAQLVLQVPLVAQMYGVQSCVIPLELREVCGSTHTAPCIGVHLPLLQTKPVAQSALPEQVVAHIPFAHTRPPGHDWVDATHVPLPSHVLDDSWPLLVHALGAHEVVVPGYWHALVPPAVVHVDPHGVPAPPHAGRDPCGAPVTCEQTPGMVGLSHASHWPVHARSQQTPSTQCPFKHWSAAVQGLPFAWVPEQVPAAQLPLTHWSLAVQLAPAASLGTHWPPLQ